MIVINSTIIGAITVLASCQGCGVEPPSPSVAIVFDQADVPADMIDDVQLGAQAWQEFGIGYSSAPLATECPIDWYAHAELFPCSITVHISFAAGSSLGGAGLTANRRSQLQSELRGDQLLEVAAHEVGHSLFGSGHVDGGAIMHSPPTSYTPTQADRVHANAATKGWVVL